MPLEHDPCCGQITPGPITVAERVADQTDLHPHTCGQVRGPNLLPSLKGASQGSQRGLSVAFGKGDCSTRVRGDRSEHTYIKARCDSLQVAACTACGLDVARGQHDLDVGRQEPDTLQLIDPRLDSTAYRSSCGIDSTQG